MRRFEGLVAAAHTPFDARGALDPRTIPLQAEFLREQGNAGVFVCGSTGEGHSLSREERFAVAEGWAREVEDAFRRHPDRILKVTDALVKERFFRSSALLKAQVSDEKAVVASMKLLSDKARFDAILAPPTKSAASAPNAVAAAGLGNAARDASSS